MNTSKFNDILIRFGCNYCISCMLCDNLRIWTEKAEMWKYRRNPNCRLPLCHWDQVFVLLLTNNFVDYVETLWIHPVDSLGCIFSDVSWGQRVFLGLFEHQTPSPRRPSRGWSVPSLHPSSCQPRGLFLQPDLPGGSLCSICHWFDGLLRSQARSPQLGPDSAEWPTSKAPTSQVRMPVTELGWGLFFSPALKNVMLFFGQWCLMVVMAEASISTTAFSTWSCHQW